MRSESLGYLVRVYLKLYQDRCFKCSRRVWVVPIRKVWTKSIKVLLGAMNASGIRHQVAYIQFCDCSTTYSMSNNSGNCNLAWRRRGLRHQLRVRVDVVRVGLASETCRDTSITAVVKKVVGSTFFLAFSGSLDAIVVAECGARMHITCWSC